MSIVVRLNLKEDDRTPVITSEQAKSLKRFLEFFPHKIEAFHYANKHHGNPEELDFLEGLHDLRKDLLLEILISGRYVVDVCLKEITASFKPWNDFNIEETIKNSLTPEELENTKLVETLRRTLEEHKKSLPTELKFEYYLDPRVNL
ncbi:hypothetical protein [Bacillus phage SBSphiJ4]|nr:hypothetical protein [Bacillus phage SBSphiJ4]